MIAKVTDFQALQFARKTLQDARYSGWALPVTH
jgi:hypothetical protein